MTFLDESDHKGKETPLCPSAAVWTPADGLGVDHVPGNVDGCSIQGHDEGMALPVTRHASNPGVNDFYYLLQGIDSLDLGLYVLWGSDWKRRLSVLNKKKQEASKKGGLLVNLPPGRNCIFKPCGKGANYSFHLQFEEYNLFIGKAARPGLSPNVYLSISAKTLWLNGIETALSWIAEDLKTIGKGSIQFVQASRVDLCADFWIPGGFSYDFLLSHKVTNNNKGNLFLDKDNIETYYLADKKSPIQLRIYNKGVEIRQKGGAKLWFLDLWKCESEEDVWRIEFQLRRPALKQFGINSLDDLNQKKAGIWHYLTAKWFSLRIPDNEKTERKNIHPLWCAVQECFQGNYSEVERVFKSDKEASPDWYLSHIDGCLSSFAALSGIKSREEAISELQRKLNSRNNARNFAEACIKKAIQRGTCSNGGKE